MRSAAASALHRACAALHVSRLLGELTADGEQQAVLHVAHAAQVQAPEVAHGRQLRQGKALEAAPAGEAGAGDGARACGKPSAGRALTKSSSSQCSSMLVLGKSAGQALGRPWASSAPPLQPQLLQGRQRRQCSEARCTRGGRLHWQHLQRRPAALSDG